MRLSFLGCSILIATMILSACGTQKVTLTETGSVLSGSQEQNSTGGVTYDSSKINIQEDNLQNLSAHMFSASGSQNVRSYIATLNGNDNDTLEKRSYLESYIGDYDSALASKEALCKSDPSQCPGEYITLTIGGAVDQSGNAIQNPYVYLNGQKLGSSAGVSKPPVYKNMIHRVRVEKEGYLDAYSKLNGIEGGFNDLSINPRMAHANKTVSLDAGQGGSEAVEGITYNISPNSFARENGEQVSGNVDTYLFSLDREDNDLSVFQLDAFGPDGSRLGESFITYGMPYMTAYQNGEPLNIVKPIEGTATILYSEGMDLKGVPKNEWLSGEQLEKYNIPPFWHLNRKAGVWNQAKMMILDEKGTYKFQYQF